MILETKESLGALQGTFFIAVTEISSVLFKADTTNIRIIQKTKMKHEYALKEYDTYVTEQNERVKLAEEVSKRYKEYLKSDEYKELLRKKRKAAKEHKERQKKYALEHGLE